VTFDEWTRTGLPPLLRFATVLCGTPYLAEDVVQDVAIKAQRSWDRIGGLDHPEAYLRRMVVTSTCPGAGNGRGTCRATTWRRAAARTTPTAPPTAMS
jgi:hypothetical protein